jgi:hypothetical protein
MEDVVVRLRQQHRLIKRTLWPDSRDEVIASLNVSKPVSLNERSTSPDALSEDGSSTSPQSYSVPSSSLNSYVLCLVVGSGDLVPKLHLLKFKGQERFNLKQTWVLRHLVKVDAVSDSQDERRFTTHFVSKKGAKQAGFLWEILSSDVRLKLRGWFLWALTQATSGFLNCPIEVRHLDLKMLKKDAKTWLSAFSGTEASESEVSIFNAFWKLLEDRSTGIAEIGRKEKEFIDMPSMTDVEARDIERFMSELGIDVDRIHSLKDLLVQRLSQLENLNSFALYSSEDMSKPILDGVVDLNTDLESLV